MAKKEDEGQLDLKDPKVQQMLHDPSAMNREAVKVGAITAGTGALVAGLQTVFVVPDFIKEVKAVESSAGLGSRVMQVAKQNKLLSFLVVAPAIAAVGTGIWGYFTAKNKLHAQAAELAAVEAKAAPQQPAYGADITAEDMARMQAAQQNRAAIGANTQRALSGGHGAAAVGRG